MHDGPYPGRFGAGWNRDGMHHIDAHRAPEGDWIACVDGWRYWPPLEGE